MRPRARVATSPLPLFSLLSLLSLAACASAPPPRPAPPRPAQTRAEPPQRDTSCSRATAPAPALRAVSLRGTELVDACKHLRSVAGLPLDEAKVEADIRALHATGLFDDVTAVVEDDALGSVLVFETKERLRVADVAVRGAPAGVEPAVALGDRPERYDPVWVRRADARLVETLREAGYRKATVAHDVQSAGPGAVSIAFLVTPGARVVLGAVRFEGLKSVSADQIVRSLALAPGEPAPDAVLERDTLVVQAALYEVGLVESQVKPRIQENFLASRFDVVFTVTEGPAYRLGAVKVTGTNLLPKGRYEKLLATIPRGSLFVRSKVFSVVQNIERMHHDAGADRTVDARTKVDTKRHVIDVDLHVD